MQQWGRLSASSQTQKIIGHMAILSDCNDANANIQIIDGEWKQEQQVENKQDWPKSEN